MGECPAGTSATGGVYPSSACLAMEEYVRYYEVNEHVELDAFVDPFDADENIDPKLECDKDVYLDGFDPTKHLINT